MKEENLRRAFKKIINEQLEESKNDLHIDPITLGELDVSFC